MGIWTLNAVSNDYTSLVHSQRQDAIDGITLTDGKPLKWLHIPEFEPFREKKKQLQKPVADIAYIAPGSIVLSPKAYQALLPLLQNFGQFLEVACINALGLLENPEQESACFYFYNVTNIIACIDAERSVKRGSAIVKPAFHHAAIPESCQIFKDPLRVRTDIYLSDSAKAQWLEMCATAHLTGGEILPLDMSFVENF